MALPLEHGPEKERRSNLEELEDRLYSRTPPPLRHDEEFGGEERHIRIAPGWTEEAERKQSGLFHIFSRIMPWMKRLFIASIIFFLFAAGVALYGFWRGGNTVSPRNISLSVLGPVGAPAGEEFSFEVTVGNYNEIDLDSVELLVDYPDGTRNPANLSAELLRYREALGALPAGGALSRRLSLVPFGEEGEKKAVRVTVEYRPKGSSGTFPQQTEYQFLINAAPVGVVVTAPSEVASGQTFDIALEIVSNSNSVIKGLLVKAEYPPGFQFEASAPPTALSKNLWQLGDLKPEGTKTVRLSGRIVAAEDEERTVRFSIGTASPKDDKALGVVFLTEAPSVSIARPVVGVELLLNGARGEKFVARSGQAIRADILWSNNLAARIIDLELIARIEGRIYTPQSVAASGGAYDAGAAAIRFGSAEQPRFREVAPGESGTVSFSFTLLPVATDPTLFQNPEMKVKVFARGTRSDTGGVSEEVVSSFSTEIKVASTLGLLSRLFYAGGPFANSGPVPPKAGTETTYTVVWSLSNSSNNVSGTRVQALLPSYARWLDQVSPSSERVTYHSAGGQVVWEVGEIAAPVGFGNAPREVAFQIAVSPSQSHVGTAPVVIGEAAAEGEDRFTNTIVTSNTRPAHTTASLSDGGDSSKSGIVVP
ncbi:MAG: Uncharacterized protein Greene041679_184 [Parcubacteria group bacterium Greene0416_79]|nr:MAG: Uncharacterized protein Greene041679_184 [Parcubacteria group bacterium Greene0416_79]